MWWHWRRRPMRIYWRPKRHEPTLKRVKQPPVPPGPRPKGPQMHCVLSCWRCVSWSTEMPVTVCISLISCGSIKALKKLWGLRWRTICARQSSTERMARAGSLCRRTLSPRHCPPRCSPWVCMFRRQRFWRVVSTKSVWLPQRRWRPCRVI